MRPSNDDGSHVFVNGNPIVTAAYFDDAMSGWLIEGNVFEDCEIGVFVNGGCDNTVRGNHFHSVDHAVYMGGDSCYNPLELGYGNLHNLSRLAAWQREFDIRSIMNIGKYSNASGWEKETCRSANNSFEANTWCNISDTQNVTWAEEFPPEPFCLNCSPTENVTNSFVGNRENCSATAHKSDDGELWMVGGFGTCGVGPTAPRSGTPDKEMAELRSFATLSFCTSPEDAVHAHSRRPGMYSFLHLGLVTNSSGERIWNVNCENGGCGHDAPPGRKSGLLDGWEGELSAAIQGIGAALRNGTVQGIFLGDEMMSAVKIPPHNWSAVATKAKALMQPFGGGLVYGNIVKW